MRWYINKNYKRIQSAVKGKAYKSGFDYEDILSEVNSKLANEISKSEPDKYDFQNDDERFMGWVYVIIKNTAINQSRAKNHTLIDRNEDALEFSQNYKQNQVKQPDIDIKNFTKELKEFIEAVFQNKPPHFRICFEQFFYNQTKYEEIARIASVPIGTVKTCIHYTRGLLKEKFGNKYVLLIKNQNEY